MRRFPIGIALLVVLLFIGFGDQILPQPIGQYSLIIRTTLNNMMINAFPQWQPKNPNNPRKEQIDKLEKR
ncbi:MAG: hypothetical protein VKJ24_00880 [Synechococcales bacterium]|nr:hypothetical protein [Synechococcales bacterium]